MITNLFNTFLLMCLIGCCQIQISHAQNVISHKTVPDSTLSKEEAFSFKTILQGGVFRNFSGGIDTGGDYIGRVHAIISLDTEKAGLWKNGQFLINGVNAHGGNPTATYIGDFQPISRNEAAPQRTALFELWYKHTFGKASITVGQHDMNSAFALSDYAGNSINSAFGVSPSITPNVGNSFSIFPKTMPCIYLQVNSIKLGKESLLNLKAAVYAGFASDNKKDPYNIKWDLNGSTHSRLELQYIRMKNELPRGSIKAGLMYHSGDFVDVTKPLQTIQGNLGYYFITDQLIWAEDNKSNQGLGLFLQLAAASGNQNIIDSFFSFGLNYKGLFPKRNEDILFLGFLNSSMNNNLVEMGLEKNRAIAEFNYALKLGEHFTIQPNLQYIINPGAQSQIDNAFLGIIRFSINF
jgi:porin